MEVWRRTETGEATRRTFTRAAGSSAHEFEAGRYAAAAAVLESATEGGSRDGAAYYWLGRARYEQLSYGKAIDAFARAVGLSPDTSEYHRWLGRAEGEEADRTHSFLLARRVRQEFEQAVRLDGSNVAARRDLMEFYLEAPRLIGGGDDKAWSQADAIAAISPVDGRLARAAYWAQKRDYTRASAEYSVVVSSTAERIDGCVEAAGFYEKTADAAGLRPVVDRLAHIDPTGWPVAYFRGVLGVLTGVDLADAATSLRTYLDRVAPRSDRPSPAAVHEWLGRLEEARHRSDLAETE